MGISTTYEQLKKALSDMQSSKSTESTLNRVYFFIPHKSKYPSQLFDSLTSLEDTLELIGEHASIYDIIISPKTDKPLAVRFMYKHHPS